MLHWKTVANLLGRLLVCLAITMLSPLFIAVYFQEQVVMAFLFAIVVTFIVGIVLVLTSGKVGKLGIKEGCTVVTLGWICATLFGSLPYCVSGVTPSFLDALFETMSGFTTTGASIFVAVEHLPQSILFWRSLTHWLGGMGIIVLFIAVLPNIGNSGFHLFKAEVPGPLAEKVKPRIQDTARILWLIYVAITGAEIVLLVALGMPILEAFNHAFATLATGGFSTKNASIGYYTSPAIQYTISFFMILAGVNFALYYHFIKSGFKHFYKESEFRLYVFLIVLFTVLITINLFTMMGYNMENSFRYALFQVVSIMTTTGFATAHFDLWPSFSKFLIFLMMFIGGCAGSTAGSMKIARLLILLKSSLLELKQIVHPKGVYSMRINGQPLPSKISSTVLQFFFIYMLIFVIATACMSFLGLSLIEAMSSVAATLGNVGPGFGLVGPSGSYAAVPAAGKSLLIFLMLLGRLELFTVLVLFLPEFWEIRLNKSKRNMHTTQI